jgi:ferredoxin
LAAKDAYRDLGRAIDGLTIRAPWNETLRAILAELYTAEEAALVSRMPTGLASLDRIASVTGFSRERLGPLLTGLASKGLVMDLSVNGSWRYTVSPLVIGIFEFTMMRTDRSVDFPRVAALFHEYLSAPQGPLPVNFGGGERVSFMRTLCHEDAAFAGTVEVLDHDKASALVENAGGMAIGTCSCRHEKLHLGAACKTAPLQSCITFLDSSAYMVRRNLCRRASKEEIKDLLAMAKERKLVLNADNVRTGVSFLCLCCACCCNVLGGIRKFGLPNIVVTSGFIAAAQSPPCTGCGKCARACPIGAIEMTERTAKEGRAPARPRVDESFCIGCGVCSLTCPSQAMRMAGRKQRTLLPENAVERVILQALERGTLQNFLVGNPNLSSSRFLRSVLCVFFGLAPVKKALMSDAFRSTFLSRIAAG